MNYYTVHLGGVNEPDDGEFEYTNICTRSETRAIYWAEHLLIRRLQRGEYGRVIVRSPHPHGQIVYSTEADPEEVHP